MVACGQHVWYDLSGYSDTAIYYGGDIVTVDDGRPEAEAVLVGDGILRWLKFLLCPGWIL